jgi:hypothetical protein
MPTFHSALAKRFHRYVVVACLPKMYYRVSSWSVVAVIYNLVLITEENICTSHAEQPTEDVQNCYPGCNDSQLSLQLLQVKDQLKVICIQHLLYQKWSVLFEKLVNAAESSPFMPQLYLYNWDTCMEFHDLLISLLVEYAKVLCKLSRPHKRQDTQYTKLL